MVAAFKVPMLKPGEYEIQRMRIEQYIKMIDYAPWDVIENSTTLPKTNIMKGVITEMPITTAEEKAQKSLEIKARSTLMLGIPNEHQLKFNSIKDAKKLMEAVEKRFGGNAATRKTQRNLLKLQYENFTSPSSEMLAQTFDRLQKLVSQLELLKEKLSQEDVNQKLLRSLSPKWNTHVIVWRNKADLDTMSMDDLYNNLKVYVPKVKGMSRSSSSTQNMPFVSSSNNNTSSTNGAVNTAQAVNIAHRVSTADNMEEMDMRWQMAMLTMRARRFLNNTERKLTVNGNETISFDKSKVECYNCYKRGHFARECKAPRNQDNKNKKSSRMSVPVETSTSIDLVSCDVPPPYTGNFMPPTPDLSFIGLDEFVNKPVIKNYDEEENVSQPKIEKKTVRPSIVKIEFVKSKQQEKTARKTIKQVEQHRQNTHSPRRNQRNWNNMMSQKLGSNFEMFNKSCYVCGSFDHLQDDCDYHQKQFQNQRMVKQKKDGIFISQDKYIAKILKKFRFTEVKTTSTSMETQKPLLKDEDGEEVDVHIYRYQVNPKVSHLYVVKRIFRKPKRKDTQVTQPSDPIEDVPDDDVHKELGDSLVRASTTASSLEAEQDNGNINKTQSKATPNESSSQGPNSDGEELLAVEHEVVVKRVYDEVNVVEEVVEVINTAKLIIDAAQDSVAGDIVSTASAATTVSVATTTTATITIVDLYVSREELSSYTTYTFNDVGKEAYSLNMKVKCLISFLDSS
nr:hypothetical protein [Tanacetum cinerariifolium]